LVENDDAAIAGCHAGPKICEEDFVPAIGTAVEGTDVITGRQSDAWEAKLNRVRCHQDSYIVGYRQGRPILSMYLDPIGLVIGSY
jgi:hypothetical protein